MIMRRLLFSLFAFICIVFIVQSIFYANANAQWGDHCEVNPEHHCYGLVSQKVNGTSAFAHVTTQGVDVEPNGYLTNELWIGFGNKGEYWIETGEVTTEGCCTRYRFYGQKYPGKPYYIKIFPEYNIPLNEEEVYGITDDGGQSPWHIEWNGEIVHSFGGWPRIYDEREIGIEVATESKPSAYGRAVGLESDGTQTWINSGNNIEYSMDPNFCEPNTEPGICGFNRYWAYAEINWGFGTGPHDELGKKEIRKLRRHHKHIYPIPVKMGSHIHGHVTAIRNDNSQVTELWVGK